MISHQRADASFDQVMSRMPPESKAAFTADQMDALKLAFRQVNWKSNHAIDIWLSIPCFKRGIYVAFLAGQERRSPQRLRAERPYYHRKAIAGLAILSLALGGVAVLGYGAIRLTLQASQRDQVHPTAIPWLQSRSACEQTGRTWENNECWDQGHSPDF
jgi:hypothetical protein